MRPPKKGPRGADAEQRVSESKRLAERPGDVDHALGLSGDLAERAPAEVKTFGGDARRARVLNDSLDSLAVARARDAHLVAAVRAVAVHACLERDERGRVAADTSQQEACSHQDVWITHSL